MAWYKGEEEEEEEEEIEKMWWNRIHCIIFFYVPTITNFSCVFDFFSTEIVRVDNKCRVKSQQVGRQLHTGRIFVSLTLW
jgi:hypothetical protein